MPRAVKGFCFELQKHVHVQTQTLCLWCLQQSLTAPFRRRTTIRKYELSWTVPFSCASFQDLLWIPGGVLGWSGGALQLHIAIIRAVCKQVKTRKILHWFQAGCSFVVNRTVFFLSLSLSPSLWDFWDFYPSPNSDLTIFRTQGLLLTCNHACKWDQFKDPSSSMLDFQPSSNIGTTTVWSTVAYGWGGTQLHSSWISAEATSTF